MVYCVAYGCKNGSGSGKSFFSFPCKEKEPSRWRLWVRMVNRKNWTPSHHAKLCQDHFERSCFVSDPAVLDSVGFKPGRLRLKKSSPVDRIVPTIFPRVELRTDLSLQRTGSTPLKPSLAISKRTNLKHRKAMKQKSNASTELILPGSLPNEVEDDDTVSVVIEEEVAKNIVPVIKKEPWLDDYTTCFFTESFESRKDNKHLEEENNTHDGLQEKVEILEYGLESSNTCMTKSSQVHTLPLKEGLCSEKGENEREECHIKDEKNEHCINISSCNDMDKQDATMLSEEGSADNLPCVTVSMVKKRVYTSAICEQPECIIEELLRLPFAQRDFREKNKIVRHGRPTPALPGLSKIGKNFVRHFQVSSYVKSKWLTGCPKKNKLFCWPCILFASEKHVWNSKGYSDLNNLHTGLLKHGRSQKHIRCWLDLKTFCSTHVELQIDEQRHAAIVQHNERVRKNRDVLHRLIDIVIYLGNQELVFHGPSEGQSSVNHGNYAELTRLVGKYDDRLASHMESCNVFSRMSNRILNDLIEAVKNVILAEIKKEIHEAKFIAVILDETSEVSSASQLSTVWRYVTTDGVVEERFTGFTDINANSSVALISEHIFACVGEMDCADKLVAQSYNGAAVMTDKLNVLQTKVKARCPCAIFVHCCAHTLNLVLSQACMIIKECKIFFSTLNGLVSFFSTSSNQKKALDDIVQRRVPGAAPILWNYSAHLVNMAKDYLHSLTELFDQIIENPLDWDQNTVISARGFQHSFKDPKFQFLLNVFYDVFSHTDVLFNILQSKILDIRYCISEVRKTTEIVQNKKGDFEKFYSKLEESTEFSAEIHRQNHSSNPKEGYKILYIKVLDTIVMQLQCRFSSLENFKFLELLNFNKFDQYRNVFPEEALTSLNEMYGHFFDAVRLHNELTVMYSSQKGFAKKSVAELRVYIHMNDLSDALAEVYKLCDLVLTLPSSTVSVEKTFSAVERIKTYVRNATLQSYMSGLAIMSIEKKLLHKLKSQEHFYDAIIEEFVKQDHWLDFIYK
ncbi:zinc finger MYM-type protein 1-like isoform X2 [Tachypleus tridentatus]|uniref:zinc finger MYM-type protein 1-like isoform X2 n=1 Tax=Tachypleus tridentatus TaxID=6853 RepID=UPI003FD251D8